MNTTKENHPNAQVLISGQDFERPKDWPKYRAEELKSDLPSKKAIAPRWGKNSKLDKG